MRKKKYKFKDKNLEISLIKDFNTLSNQILFSAVVGGLAFATLLIQSKNNPSSILLFLSLPKWINSILILSVLGMFLIIIYKLSKKLFRLEQLYIQKDRELEKDEGGS